MATKCIIIGSSCEHKPLVPIEFTYVIGSRGTLVKADHTPKMFRFVELITREYDGGLDVMFAYSYANRSDGVLLLGKWNDGCV